MDISMEKSKEVGRGTNNDWGGWRVKEQIKERPNFNILIMPSNVHARNIYF
jgi:hypothetical protein